MEKHAFKILSSLPAPHNHTQLLIQSFHRLQQENLVSKNDSACKNCLTPWTSGQFTLKTRPSNHKRRKRRQHRIEKLQKELKSIDKKPSLTALKRRVQHLQHINNHLAIYTCELCKHSTKVLLWKPKPINRQGNLSATAVKTTEKSDEPVKKEKKNKGKKKKTAGLIMPSKKTEAQSVNKQLSMAKLSSMFQQTSSTSSTQMSKLNQFLK